MYKIRWVAMLCTDMFGYANFLESSMISGFPGTDEFQIPAES